MAALSRPPRLSHFLVDVLRVLKRHTYGPSARSRGIYRKVRVWAAPDELDVFRYAGALYVAFSLSA